MRLSLRKQRPNLLKEVGVFKEEECGDSVSLVRVLQWETDFYTPPVLRGAALFDNSAPAVYKIQGP